MFSLRYNLINRELTKNPPDGIVAGITFHVYTHNTYKGQYLRRIFLNGKQ